jgi:O-antigen/teichoic acid export membrane protein
LLNKLKGAYDTGIYGMGSTLGQIPQILVHSINKAYVPYVFENYKRVGNDDNANLNNLIKTTTLLFSLITAFVCLLISFSNNIISFFSPQYLESGIIMVLILIAFLIDAYRIIFMNPISYNVKYVKIKSAVWMFSAIFSIGLNLILIPRYSMYGACISLLLSYSTSFLLILYFSNKAMKILYEKDKMFKVFFLSLLFALSFFVGFSILALTIKILLTIIYLYILFKILDIYPLKGIK